AGVCNERRFRRRRDTIGSGPRIGMAEIKCNADLIHLRDGLAPKVGQPIRLAVETTDPEWGTSVIAKLHDTHAQPAEQLDALDFALQHVDTFKRIDNAEFSLFPGAFEVAVR